MVRRETIMFKFSVQKRTQVTQAYCLLCASVIASSNGYSANLNTTELEERTGELAMFYRALYILIAGVLDTSESKTVNGMTLTNYMETFYDKAESQYNAVNGADEFSRLSEVDRFMLVLKNTLLPSVCDAVCKQLAKDGKSIDEIKISRAAFIKDFVPTLMSTLDGFVTLSPTPQELWNNLYNFAIDMPHVVIGLRKQVSTYNSDFFRNNKENLESLTVFMKAQNLKYSNYTDRLSIAGIIINNFKSHYIGRYMTEYGHNIASGAATYVDDEGVILYNSDLQDKMYANDRIHDIDNFEVFMRSIELGSELYDVGGSRYFNLIEWRQNKIKEEIVNKMRNMPIATKLGKLGLGIGGYLTSAEISETMGGFTGDKQKRFDILDEMISMVYHNEVDSSVAKELIKDWVNEGIRGFENGEYENGRYPMDFRTGKKRTGDRGYTEKFYTNNRNRFNNLIKGINAMKALEFAIKGMGSTILSFPVYGQDNAPHKLLLGVNLSDYLNQIKAIDTSIEIKSDIEGSEELNNSEIIDNVSDKSNEVMRVVTRKHIIEKISMGSLTDEDMAIAIDSDSDREMLRLLKNRGFELKIKGSKDKDKNEVPQTIREIVFDNIVDTFSESKSINQLDLREFGSRTVKLNKRETDDYNGFAIGMLKHISSTISLISKFGKLTRNNNSDARLDQLEQDHYVVNNNKDTCITLDMRNAENLIPKISGKNTSNLTKLFNRELTADEIKALEKSYYYNAWLQGKFFFESPPEDVSAEVKQNYVPYWNRGSMLKMPRIFLKNDGTPAMVWSMLTLYIPSLRTRVGKDATFTVADFIKDICDRFADTLRTVANCNVDKGNQLYVPRTICTGINTNTILNYIYAALDLISLNLKPDETGVNGDNNVEAIRNAIKGLRALDTLHSSNNLTDKYKLLKTYTDIFDEFFASVDIELKGFNKTDKGAYHKLVFLDSLEDKMSDIDDVDEMLYQYKILTNIAHQILTNPSLYKIEFGGAKHTILDFIGLVNELLVLDTKQQNNLYFIGSMAMSTIQENMQTVIEYRINEIMKNKQDIFVYSESNTWLDNLIEYSEFHGFTLDRKIINGIRMNYERYAINSHNLVTLDNRVIHTSIHKGSTSYKAVLSRFGIFGYSEDGRVFEMNGVNDLRWLLH